MCLLASRQRSKSPGVAPISGSSSRNHCWPAEATAVPAPTGVSAGHPTHLHNRRRLPRTAQEDHRNRNVALHCGLGDRLVIHSTAYEGELYRGRVKTDASRNAVPIPDAIIPIVEAWRRECLDSSPEALMFPTFGRAERTGRKVPRRAKNFLKWRIYPLADKPNISRKLVTFQVMRRTLGTDLQKHGTMKDAQGALRHAHQDNGRRVHAGDSRERPGGH